MADTWNKPEWQILLLWREQFTTDTKEKSSGEDTRAPRRVHWPQWITEPREFEYLSEL